MHFLLQVCGGYRGVLYSIPYGDEQSIEHMQEGKAQRQQAQLLPAQHPVVQPIREAPASQ